MGISCTLFENITQKATHYHLIQKICGKKIQQKNYHPAQHVCFLAGRILLIYLFSQSLPVQENSGGSVLYVWTTLSLRGEEGQGSAYNYTYVLGRREVNILI